MVRCYLLAGGERVRERLSEEEEKEAGKRSSEAVRTWGKNFKLDNLAEVQSLIGFCERLREGALPRIILPKSFIQTAATRFKFRASSLDFIFILESRDSRLEFAHLFLPQPDDPWVVSADATQSTHTQLQPPVQPLSYKFYSLVASPGFIAYCSPVLLALHIFNLCEHNLAHYSKLAMSIPNCSPPRLFKRLL